MFLETVQMHLRCCRKTSDIVGCPVLYRIGIEVIQPRLQPFALLSQTLVFISLFIPIFDVDLAQARWDHVGKEAVGPVDH